MIFNVTSGKKGPVPTLVGIDTSDVIASYGTGTHEVTATEDCWIVANTNNFGPTIYINNVPVVAGMAENGAKQVHTPCKAGQTWKSNVGNTGSVKVYGLKV